MKRRAVFAAIVLGVVLVAGVAYRMVRRPGPAEVAPPGVETTLRIGHENDIATLDPVMIGDIFTFRVAAQIFEGLLELDAENRAVPALAASWEASPQFDRWTFTIRDDVMFHESDVFGQARTRKVTARDVAFSFERSLAPTSIAAFVLGDIVDGVKEYQAGKTQHVSGIRTLDDRRVEIRLVRPEHAFLHRLTSPYLAVFPEEALTQGADTFGRRLAIGTGPYRLVRMTDVEVVLERNARYWRRLPDAAPRELRVRVIKNDQVRLAEFRNGNLDVVRVTPGLADAFVEPAPDGALALKAEWAGRATLVRAPTLSSFFIAFNTERVPREVRRAVQDAVERRQIVDVVAKGAATPRLGTVPSGLEGYEPLDAVPAGTSSAGRPRGQPFELLVHEQDGADVLGELVQAQLARAGLEVRLRKLDFNTVIQRMVDGNFEALALSFQYVYSAPEPILGAVFHSRSIPSPNIWRYRNPLVDAQIDRLGTLADRARAHEVVRAIEQAVYQDAPAVFLYQADNLFVLRQPLRIPFTRHGVPRFVTADGR